VVETTVTHWPCVRYVPRPRGRRRFSSPLVASPEALELAALVLRSVTRAPHDSREVPVPFRVFQCPPSSALLASSATPSSFERPRGFPRRTLLREIWVSRCFPRGVLVLLRARRASPSARSSLAGSTGPPLVRFLLPATHYAGCPSPHELPLGRSRGVRIARPSPVPSSGSLPLSTVSAGSRLSPWPTRRFAVLFHTARVRGAPLQSFPSPRSRSRSRGPLLPCGFVVRSSPGAEPPGSS
jgi:hypothetical protein